MKINEYNLKKNSYEQTTNAVIIKFNGLKFRDFVDFNKLQIMFEKNYSLLYTWEWDVRASGLLSTSKALFWRGINP